MDVKLLAFPASTQDTVSHCSRMILGPSECGRSVALKVCQRATAALPFGKELAVKKRKLSL
jgi:hypothetical protein